MCVFGEGCFKYINKNVLILWDNIVSQTAVANMSITIEFSSPIVPVLQLVDVCYQNRHLFLAALQPYKSKVVEVEAVRKYFSAFQFSYENKTCSEC